MLELSANILRNFWVLFWKFNKDIQDTILERMNFWDLFSFHRVSKQTLERTRKLEASIANSFLVSDDMLAVKRIFRYPTTFPYLLRVKARCSMVDRMAACLSNAAAPLEFYDQWNVGYAGRYAQKRGSATIILQRKLKCYLLLLGDFLECYRKGLAEYAGGGLQLQSTLPICSHVEGQLLHRYTPHAIKMLIGMHDYLYAIVEKKLERRNLGLSCGVPGSHHRYTEVFTLGTLEMVSQLCAQNQYNGGVYDWAVCRIWQSTATKTRPLRPEHNNYTYQVGSLPAPIVPPLNYKMGKKVLELLPRNSALLQQRDLRLHGFGWAASLQMNDCRAYFHEFMLNDVEDGGLLLLGGPRDIGRIEGLKKAYPGLLCDFTRFREICLNSRN